MPEKLKWSVPGLIKIDVVSKKNGDVLLNCGNGSNDGNDCANGTLAAMNCVIGTTAAAVCDGGVSPSFCGGGAGG